MTLNLHASSDLITREFLGVILAESGNELLPLTSGQGEPCPKALLPIANKPLLDYMLSWLEQSGIRDVLLICPMTHRPLISHHIHSASFSSLSIDLQTYDDSQDAAIGTCKLLRHFASRIQEDFVLLPCDFIPPLSLPLSSILNKFRTDALAGGIAAVSCWIPRPLAEKGVSLEQWDSLSPPVSIAWDGRTNMLLHVDTPDAEDYNAEDLELRMGLLSRYPHVVLSTEFQDSHVYVCRKSVLDILQESPSFDSFREEFLPWLCKVQYQPSKRDKYLQVLKYSGNNNTSSQLKALKHSTTYLDLVDGNKCSTLSFHSHLTCRWQHANDTITMSSPPSPSGFDADECGTPSLRVGVLIHQADAGFAARVNNLQSFLEINRHFLAETISMTFGAKSRLHIGQISDSIVDESTRVGENTSIKNSVIGQHCVIDRQAKIVGCVILDHCVIGEGAKLNGCILGKNTRVGSKVNLLQCTTQPGYDIPVGEDHKNEKLENSDWTHTIKEDISMLDESREGRELFPAF